MSPINTFPSSHFSSGASGPQFCLPGTAGAGALGDERGHRRGARRRTSQTLHPLPPGPPRTPRRPTPSEPEAPESPSIQRQQLPTCSTCAHLSKTIQEEKRESLYTFYSANFSRGTVGSLRKEEERGERITINVTTAHLAADCCLLADWSGLEEEGAEGTRRGSRAVSAPGARLGAHVSFSKDKAPQNTVGPCSRVS